jgi:hypothetical protein
VHHLFSASVPAQALAEAIAQVAVSPGVLGYAAEKLLQWSARLLSMRLISLLL